jgi:hypothetical protein
LESLLRPGIIQQVLQELDENPKENTVIFMVLARYFMNEGQLLESMVADLLNHRKSSQNGGAPLMVKADVPRSGQIAHARMKFLSLTYRLFKDAQPKPSEANLDLIRLYMKTCLKHYQAFLPQLDLITTQWGVELEEASSQFNLGSLRSEGARQKQKESLDKQLRKQVQETRRQQVAPKEGLGPASGPAAKRTLNHAKSTIETQSNELQRMKVKNVEEVTKRRKAEELCSKVEEDLRLLHNQDRKKSSTTSSAAGLSEASSSAATGEELRRPPLVTSVPLSASGTEVTSSSEMGLQLLQCLRDATGSAGSMGKKPHKLADEYPEGHTMRTYYQSLAEPWDILPPILGPVKEYKEMF